MAQTLLTLHVCDPRRCTECDWGTNVVHTAGWMVTLLCGLLAQGKRGQASYAQGHNRGEQIQRLSWGGPLLHICWGAMTADDERDANDAHFCLLEQGTQRPSANGVVGTPARSYITAYVRTGRGLCLRRPSDSRGRVAVAFGSFWPARGPDQAGRLLGKRATGPGRPARALGTGILAGSRGGNARKAHALLIETRFVSLPRRNVAQTLWGPLSEAIASSVFSPLGATPARP